MKIGKTELREFIDVRIEKNISQVNKELDDMIKQLAEEYVYETSDVVGLHALEHEAQSLAEKLQHVVDTHKLENNSSVSSALSNINWYITTIYSQICKEMESRIAKVVKSDSYYNREFTIEKAEESKLYDEKLLANTRHAIKLSKDYYKKIDDLKKLKKELNNIISVEHTGYKAYKKFEELGVDMSGFEPEEKHLPAVKSLSVDVSLFKRG
jgi:hypothetical protein